MPVAGCIIGPTLSSGRIEPHRHDAAAALLPAAVQEDFALSIFRVVAMVPAIFLAGSHALAGPGPDIAVCDIHTLTQYGRVGDIGSGIVGLAFATAHYNAGDAGMEFLSLPSNRHPVLTQNMYRRVTVDGSVRFEQIGQSWVFNTYCPLQQSACGTCQPDGICGPTLGAGCSTPHSAGNHAGQVNLSARGFVNPFTGEFPTTLNSHAHAHDAVSHRLQVRDADLVTIGTSYFIESQAIAADDAAGGNQLNNVGYRAVTVSGPNGSGLFSFGALGGVVQGTPAIDAWATATQVYLEPSPGTDGRLIVAYEVTPIGSDLYHYEYAIYNMDNDAAVGSLTIPADACAGLSGVGFHAVPNHEAVPDAPSYSNEPWAFEVGGRALTWTTQTFAENQNANAIRWGTMYNFRFDAAGPPTPVTATIGMFKTGASADVTIMAPGRPPGLAADINADCILDAMDTAILVDVLIGVDTDPGHVDRADLDQNGTADSRDIAAFLAVL